MRRPAAWMAATSVVVAGVVGVVRAGEVRSGGAQPESQPVSRVVLRGGGDGGEAMAVSPAGVLVRSAGAEFVVGWDRVSRVQGALAGEAAAFEGISTLAWRARTRLERGDAVAAEPLYEELFRRLDETDGPTALSICEGLLRCRLWRGAHALSMEAWLNWIRIAGAEGAPAGPRAMDATDARSRIWSMALLPVIDEETGLVTSLPPVWLPGPSVRAMVAGATPLLSADAQGPGVARARALGDLYLHAARHEGGDRRAAPEIDPQVMADPGVALVADVVLARAGDAAQREAARTALRARLTDEMPAWQDAWCRIGLGRSLIVEGDEARVMEGVVQLMHLPARFGEEQAYLTGVALAEASRALSKLGDVAGAEALQALLQQSYAGHPALEWTEMVRPAPPGRSAQPATGTAAPGGPAEPAPSNGSIPR